MLEELPRDKQTTLLYMNIEETDIVVDNKGTEITTKADSGIKARFMKDNVWQDIAASTNQMDWLKDKLAEQIPERKRLKTAPGLKTCKRAGKINPDKIALKQKIADLKKIQKEVRALSKDFINVRVRLSLEKETKQFLSEEKHFRQELNLTTMVVVAFFNSKQGDVRYHYIANFKPGYEAIKLPKKKINNFLRMVKKIQKGQRITPGKYTCVLNPHMAGLLAHESFGHGMESDTILKDRAMAKSYLGKKLAKNYVSIIDNPAYSVSHGSFFFDDEGHIAGPVYLMDKGVVNHPITESYSADKLGFTHSANSRAESYDHKIYARMSNTYFDNGPHDPKEMIKSVKDGFYLHSSSGGMEDPKGWGIQIQGVMAERIKNGKLTGQMFYEVGMTGFLPDLLANIRKVGNDLEVKGVGRCGKGHKEWVRVSEGGPHLLIDKVTLA